MSRSVITALALAAALCGCQPGDSTPRVDDPPPGREETRGIRNTEAVGYAGDAIANKVDAALDASDAAKKRLDDAEAQQAQ